VTDVDNIWGECTACTSQRVIMQFCVLIDLNRLEVKNRILFYGDNS
jgi:hypothetical protein